jgi:ParB-like chromosome segregation protein Spo0J
MIVRGHGRLAAAKLAGCTHCPVDYQDYASDALEIADLIADNRLGELAEMDNAALKDLLQEIDTGELDTTLTGYEEGDLEDMMTSEPPETEPTVTCPKCGEVFTPRPADREGEFVEGGG